MTANESDLVLHGTTILAVRHRGRVVLAGDGQVSMQNTVIKNKVAEPDSLLKYG